jgi:hypothetical protein
VRIQLDNDMVRTLEFLSNAILVGVMVLPFVLWAGALVDFFYTRRRRS